MSNPPQLSLDAMIEIRRIKHIRDRLRAEIKGLPSAALLASHYGCSIDSVHRALAGRYPKCYLKALGEK
jgi:hypothetical protein